MFRKLILFAIVAILAVPVVNAGVKVHRIETASLADDAIDTSFVDISDAKYLTYDNDGAALTVALRGLISNLETSAGDSIQVAIDVGDAYGANLTTASGTSTTGGGAWVEVYAIDNDAAHLDKQEAKAVVITTVGSALRFRVKNFSGSALVINAAFHYLTED